MQQYCVKKTKQPIDWTVSVPGSKSITNRALLIAALSKREVTLDGVLFSDDSRYFLESLKQLGFTVDIREGERRVIVRGCGGTIPAPSGEIYVGSAGTAARFLTAMLGVSEGTYRIDASAQMQKRPMAPLFEALITLGAQVKWLGEKWHLPVEITGAGSALKAAAGATTLELDISESTQFLSAFLLISPMFPHGVDIRITSKKTDGSYIRITRRMMEEFSVISTFADGVYRVPAMAYERSSYQIEPDVSAACYFYGAAAVTGGSAKVLHVHKNGMQGDLKFLDVLEQMGCSVSEEEDGIVVKGPHKLCGVSVNMNDFSDQALTLAAIAPYANGPVSISGIAHIRKQESDRIGAIVSNLTRAGIACEERPDGVLIRPGEPKPCRIETFEDHRVAMAFAVMGLRADGICILDPLCCRKTFEEFFDVLDRLSETA